MEKKFNYNHFTLVSTRNEDGLLFGTIDNPMNEAEVKEICLKFYWEFHPIKNYETDAKIKTPGAVYCFDYNEIVWYDLSDGTVVEL